jgi:hypothetical protein
VKDSVAPSGYIIDAITDPINNQNETNIQIDFLNLEIGATAFWSITDGVNTINDDFIVAATSETIFEDVSTLNNGTLTVSLVLVDTAGNQGVIETGTTNKQVFTPSGYSVAFDEASYDGTTGLNATIDISGANVGNSYSLTITSSGGGTPIVYTGTVGSATFTISNIDLTTLNTGTGTATYFETDSFGNIGGDATDTATFSFYSYVLDDYPNAEASYSLRKLRSAYTGDAIRVRRNNDNAEQDIGFVNNELDTANLLAFVGANNGFVTTWYDQSGNGRDATQSNASAQPKLVDAGVLLTKNGKPAISFDGVNDFLRRGSTEILNTGNPFGIFIVLNEDAFPDNNGIFSISTNQTNCFWAFINVSSTRQPFTLVAPQSQYTFKGNSSGRTLNQQLWGILFNGVDYTNNINYNFSVDGIDINSINAGSALPTNTNDFRIGRGNSNYVGEYMVGKWQEFIIYTSDQSSNRVGIETNINDFYSIYP